MSHSIDERGFRELSERSDDLHSDAMKVSRRDLDTYVDAAKEAEFQRSKVRDRLVSNRGLVTAGVVGAGLVAVAAPAFGADKSTDVMALQTAAGIENLAVGTYKTALTLPYIGGSAANGVVKAFAMKTMAQHAEHAQAFNAAATRLGGKAQSAPDPKYAPIVAKAVPTIKSAADVVALAITLEDVAAQTYVKNVGVVSTADLRQLFSSVAGVESQHKAILLAVQALIKGGAPQLIALPPDAAKLPAAAGSVGFPDAFYPTSMAAPVSEGAVT